MKKIFSYGIVLLSAILLAGCTNNVEVSKDEVVKFNGGSITKTEAYNQMITTANYDKTYTLVKAILTKVDMQLLAKDATYTSKIKDEDVTKEYNDIVTKFKTPEETFKLMTKQFGVSVTNEEEAKNIVRFKQLSEQLIIEKGSSDEDVTKAYEQQDGEKVHMRFLILDDKSKAEELQKELVAGTVKFEDIEAQLKEFQKTQQVQQAQGVQAPKFTFKDKYPILAADNTGNQPLFKKTGVFKSEDENTIFNRANKDVWIAPLELQSKSPQAEKQHQYIITNPSQYVDATKQLDDNLKAEIKKTIAATKLQSASEIEKVMREYRKSKGFEIYDEQLKKAFDGYEKSVDTPAQNDNFAG